MLFLLAIMIFRICISNILTLFAPGWILLDFLCNISQLVTDLTSYQSIYNTKLYVF